LRRIFAAVIFLLPPIVTCIAANNDKKLEITSKAIMPASLLTVLFLIIILFAWVMREDDK